MLLLETDNFKIIPQDYLIIVLTKQCIITIWQTDQEFFSENESTL